MAAKTIIESTLSGDESTLQKFNFGQEWVDAKYLKHKVDGPAVLYNNGARAWFIHGKRHRLDGPAEVGRDYQQWWVDGKRHRIDGPAIDYNNGEKQWFVNGRRFTEDEFNLYVDQNTGELFMPPGKKLKYDDQYYL